jgi:hypothetical protein
MRIIQQPANSPDFNVLGLGFFSSLQTLQHRKVARNIEQLVNNVDESFRELTFDRLDRVFMTLQTVMEASLNVQGDNRYAIPHRNKTSLVDANGLLPVSTPCDRQVYDDAMDSLQSSVAEVANV